eukprot:3518919-Rhodomonas_salina.2
MCASIGPGTSPRGCRAALRRVPCFHGRSIRASHPARHNCCPSRVHSSLLRSSNLRRRLAYLATFHILCFSSTLPSASSKLRSWFSSELENVVCWQVPASLHVNSHATQYQQVTIADAMPSPGVFHSQRKARR